MIFIVLFGLVMGVILLVSGNDNLDFFLAGANLMGAAMLFFIWLRDIRDAR